MFKMVIIFKLCIQLPDQKRTGNYGSACRPHKLSRAPFAMPVGVDRVILLEFLISIIWHVANILIVIVMQIISYLKVCH